MDATSLGGERLAGDRRHPQDRNNVLGQPRQPALDDRGHRVGHRRRRDIEAARLRHELAELPHEQRVARAPLDDRVDRRGRHALPGGRSQQLRRRLG